MKKTDIRDMDYKQYREMSRKYFTPYDIPFVDSPYKIYQDKVNDKQREFKKDSESFWKDKTREMIFKSVEEYLVEYVYNPKKTYQKCSNAGIGQGLIYTTGQLMYYSKNGTIDIHSEIMPLYINIIDYLLPEWKDKQLQMPEKYYYRCQHIMAASGYKKVFMFVYNNGAVEIRIVEKDKEAIERIKDAITKFKADHIKPKKTPVPTAKDVDLIKQIKTTKIVNKNMNSYKHEIDLYLAYSKEISEANKLEKERKRLKAILLDAMDGAIMGHTDTAKISNKKQFRVTSKVL